MNDKNIFIIKPNYGLCNQLLTIVNGIVVSNIYNRNLIIDRFQKNWGNHSTFNFCDIDKILDIEKFNSILNDLGLETRILSNISDEFIKSASYIQGININKISDCENITKYIDLPENIIKKKLIIGNIVSHDCGDDFRLLVDKIKVSIPFQKIFYDIAIDIKLGNDYQCCHLRLEDDAIVCFSDILNININDYNNEQLKFYTENIRKCDNLYICSGLDLPNNQHQDIKNIAKKMGIDVYKNHLNSDYYQNLLSKYNFIVVRDKGKLFEFISNNRELNAIIDLIIAYKSSFFIGNRVSSFSLFVANYFRKNNKKFILG